MVATDVTIRSTIRGEPAVTFGLLGDATPSRQGSNVGWLGVDRPRRETFTEFQGVALHQLVLPLLVQGGDSTSSCEQDVAVIESWFTTRPATGEPPTLKVTGPVPFTSLTWVATGDPTYGAAIRLSDGARTQQQLSLTLLEYRQPVVQFTNAAKRATERLGASAAKGVTVARAGDTLVSIATRVLHDYRKWTVLAALNGIRDGNAKLATGRKIKLPAGK